MRKLIVVAILMIAMMVTGCATIPAYTQTDQAIESGARWGAVGAATGALVGVASRTDVGRAAALGALILGLPAMAAEMLGPPPAPAALAVLPAAVYLPGPKEVYISSWLQPEVKWEVVKELRNLGYQVSEDSSVPLILRVEMREVRDPKYICVMYLVDRLSRRIIAQGRGEARLILISKEWQLEAQRKAAIAAIRSLN